MSKIDPNKLLISSDFYSVQGEGISSGVPSYFVRFGVCNLTCGMSRMFTNKLMKEQTLEDGEIFVGDTPYSEIETNGTIYIGDELFNQLDQINCSPKLANSGMTEKQRIVPAAIKRIMEHKNYQFKFVISTEEDVQELFRDFVVPFNIPLKNVVCMPGLDDAAEFEERTQFCLEMAKKYRFRGLTRLHIAAWNKTLNV